MLAQWIGEIVGQMHNNKISKSQLADHGKIPPMTWVFDATNNFDYYNTSEYKLVDETPKEQKALSASDLPKLGAFTGNTETLLPHLGQVEQDEN